MFSANKVLQGFRFLRVVRKRGPARFHDFHVVGKQGPAMFQDFQVFSEQGPEQEGGFHASVLSTNKVLHFMMLSKKEDWTGADYNLLEAGTSIISIYYM